MTNICSTFCNRLHSAGKDIGIIAAYTSFFAVAGVIIGIWGVGKFVVAQNPEKDCASIPDESDRSKCIDDAKAQYDRENVEMIVGFSFSFAFVGVIIGFLHVLHRHKVLCFKEDNDGKRPLLEA